MIARFRQRALLALVVVTALLGLVTFGAAHTCAHWSNGSATASDCGTCIAVKSAAAAPVNSPPAVEPAPEPRRFTACALLAHHAEADLVSISSRAPPLV